MMLSTLWLLIKFIVVLKEILKEKEQLEIVGVKEQLELLILHKLEKNLVLKDLGP